MSCYSSCRKLRSRGESDAAALVRCRFLKRRLRVGGRLLAEGRGHVSAGSALTQSHTVLGHEACARWHHHGPIRRGGTCSTHGSFQRVSVLGRSQGVLWCAVRSSQQNTNTPRRLAPRERAVRFYNGTTRLAKCPKCNMSTAT